MDNALLINIEIKKDESVGVVAKCTGSSLNSLGLIAMARNKLDEIEANVYKTIEDNKEK